MNHAIDVVPEAWWALGDTDSFYPGDLPDEWRLTYFANQFGAALVPESAWGGRSAAALADWRADVHLGFRFFLECGPETNRGALACAADALGPALVAFVQAPQREPSTEPDGEPDWGPDRGPVTKPLRAQSRLRTEASIPASRLLAPDARRNLGSALRCPRQLNGDLRGARDWLGQLAEKPRLVILDRPTASELEAWRHLVVLMGLG